tara:strand:- start:2638 stop:3870 length:1233 start_codon:yes stop_codon:yes gene_type:complete
MFDHFIEPPLLISLILDIGNYMVFFILFYIARQAKIINSNLFALAGLMLLTPFFGNGFLFSWTQLPDQSKYLKMAQEIRSNFPYIANAEFCNGSILHVGAPGEDCSEVGFFSRQQKVRFSSLLFSFSPLISLESFKSIGFLNRALFIFTLLFFIKKKYLPLYVKLFFIFSPSAIMYSSVSLRDNLILLSLIWALYFFLKRSYIFLIITCIILYIIKLQNLLILLTLFYLIMTFEDSKYKMMQTLSKLSMLSVIPFFYFYGKRVLEFINGYRFGFFSEENGVYVSMTGKSEFEPLIFSYATIPYLIERGIFFLTAPVTGLNGPFDIIISFEIFLIYVFLFRGFIKDIKIKSLKNITLIWMFIFFFVAALHGMILFNDGMVARYRIVLFLFVMIGYEMHKSIIMSKHKTIRN